MIIDSPILSGSVVVSGSFNLTTDITGSNIIDQNTVIALAFALGS